MQEDPAKSYSTAHKTLLNVDNCLALINFFLIPPPGEGIEP